MGRKRSRGGGDFEDQYGEVSISQDREGRVSGPGRGQGSFAGGGDAGAGRKDREVHLVRSVPKFLQGHIHLLGRKGGGGHDHDEEPEAEQLTAAEGEALQHEGDDEREALEKAVLENPALADEHLELRPILDRAKATEAKEAGNCAFAAKDFEGAVQHFTRAIALHDDPVFYSNRAAAYHALKQHRRAAADARRVVSLDANWVKGWARLAAAHFALEEWSEAKDAYALACKLEPCDHALQTMLHKSEVNEAKQEAEKVVKFKQSRQTAQPVRNRSSGSAVRNARLLSFNDNDDG